MKRRSAKRTAAPALWLRALLVAAVVMSAFAHRAAVAAPTPLDLAQYVLPDGSLPEICDTSGEGGTGHLHPACEFCLIAGASAPAEPATPDLSRPLPRLLQKTVALAAGPPVVPVELTTASKRGPPSVSV